MVKHAGVAILMTAAFLQARSSQWCGPKGILQVREISLSSIT